MLGQIIEKIASSWVEYNQRKLIDGIFRTAPKIQRAIDVGCGDGSYSPLLLDSFPNCDLLVGVDIRKERIMLATQRRTDSRSSYIIASTHALPFRTSAFELAFSKDLLHHIDKPIKGLKEISRVTIGEIVVVEANRPNPLMLLWTRYFNHQHLTWSQLRKIVDKASLQLECSKQIRAYPLDLFLLPIKHPIQYAWNPLVLVFLFACYVVPALCGASLKTLSLIAKTSFNVLFVKGIVGNNSE